MKKQILIKFSCIAINLLVYYFAIFVVFIIALLEGDAVWKPLEQFLNNRLYVILTSTLPLIILIVITLILKHKYDREYKIELYRIIDTITRIISTLPITIFATYYICNIYYHSLIINSLIGVAIFYVLDRMIKYTFQQILSVSITTRKGL